MQSKNSKLFVNEITGWQDAGIKVLGIALRSWQGTLHYSGLQEIEEAYNAERPGSLILLWHNRLLIANGMFNAMSRRERRLYALVSASRDGALLAAFLRTQGIACVRGSSSRRGGEAARGIVKLLRAGHHVAITVDGPRGPCYTVHEGAAFLARLTGAPVFLLGAEAESCWRMNSWDGFMLPKPFSVVRMKMQQLFAAGAAPQLAGAEVLEAIRAGLQNQTSDLHLTDRWSK